MPNQQFTHILQKEVSRKEFLGISALALGSVMGIGGALRLLTGKSLTTAGKQQSGYGGSFYGK